MQLIIRENINDKIVFNIMDLKHSKDMGNNLKSVFTKVGQGVVYYNLQKLLPYPNIIKPKRYEKLVMQIFLGVR